MKFTQLPGTLDVEFITGDELAVSIDFDRDISGYSIEAPVYVTQVFVTGVGGTGSAFNIGSVVTDWVIAVVDAQAGTLSLGLSEAQTALLNPSVRYRWFLRWVDTNGYTRTVLSGAMTARSP